MKVTFFGGRMDGKKREVPIPYPIIHINEPRISAVKNDIEEYELRRGRDGCDYYCYTGKTL